MSEHSTRPKFNTCPARLRKRDVPAVWDLFDHPRATESPDVESLESSALTRHASFSSVASESSEQTIDAGGSWPRMRKQRTGESSSMSLFEVAEALGEQPSSADLDERDTATQELSSLEALVSAEEAAAAAAETASATTNVSVDSFVEAVFRGIAPSAHTTHANTTAAAKPAAKASAAAPAHVAAPARAQGAPKSSRGPTANDLALLEAIAADEAAAAAHAAARAAAADAKAANAKAAAAAANAAAARLGLGCSSSVSPPPPTPANSASSHPAAARATTPTLSSCPSLDCPSLYNDPEGASTSLHTESVCAMGGSSAAHGPSAEITSDEFFAMLQMELHDPAPYAPSAPRHELPLPPPPPTAAAHDRHDDRRRRHDHRRQPARRPSSEELYQYHGGALPMRRGSGSAQRPTAYASLDADGYAFPPHDSSEMVPSDGLASGGLGCDGLARLRHPWEPRADGLADAHLRQPWEPRGLSSDCFANAELADGRASESADDEACSERFDEASAAGARYPPYEAYAGAYDPACGYEPSAPYAEEPYAELNTEYMSDGLREPDYHIRQADYLAARLERAIGVPLDGAPLHAVPSLGGGTPSATYHAGTELAPPAVHYAHHPPPRPTEHRPTEHGWHHYSPEPDGSHPHHHGWHHYTPEPDGTSARSAPSSRPSSRAPTPHHMSSAYDLGSSAHTHTTAPPTHAGGGGGGGASERRPPRNGAERKEWSASEDAIIKGAVETHGCKWRKIAAMLPGRSDDAVRNRYNRLREMDANHANGPGASTGTPMSGGTLEGLERRTVGGADGGASAGGAPSSRREPSKEKEKPERVSWSKAEDETILRSVRELGHKWNKIAERLPGRTDHAIRNRFHRLQALLEDRQRQQQRVLAPSMPLHMDAIGGADLKGVNVNAALVPPAAASKHELLVVDGLHGGGENGFDTPVGGSGSALTTPGSR